MLDQASTRSRLDTANLNVEVKFDVAVGSESKLR